MDLTAETLFVHLDVENIGAAPGNEWPWYFGKRNLPIRLGLVTAEGKIQGYTAIRAKEGALTEENGSFRFPAYGLRGAFVMEFPVPQDREGSFSISVNDLPLLAGINLRRAAYQSF